MSYQTIDDTANVLVLLRETKFLFPENTQEDASFASKVNLRSKFLRKKKEKINLTCALIFLFCVCLCHWVISVWGEGRDSDDFRTIVLYRTGHVRLHCLPFYFKKMF